MSVLSEMAQKSATYDKLTLFQRLRMIYWEWAGSSQYQELKRLWEEGMTAEAAYHNAKNMGDEIR